MLRPKRITPVRAVLPGRLAPSELSRAADEFIAWTLAVGMSPDTAKIRRSALDRFVSWCHERHVGEPNAIGHSMIEAYQGYLAASRRADGAPIALTTRATRLNPVIAFCRWALRHGVVAADPCAQIVLPHVGRRLPCRVPTMKEVSAILRQPRLSTCAGVRDRAVMETLYSTALRRMELARLRLADVSVDARAVMVRSGKGGNDRMVPLGERAARWLERYLRDVRPRLAHPGSPQAVFLTDYGEAFEKNRLGDMVRRHVANSGFPGRGACHLFRHACATHMLENGADIRYIQAMLGHAQLSTTEIYTHVSISKLEEVHAATHPAGSRRQSR